MVLFPIYLVLNEFINDESTLYTAVTIIGFLSLLGLGFLYKDDIVDEKALLTSQCKNDLIVIKHNFALAYTTFLPFSVLCGVGFGIIYMVQNTTSSNNNSSSSNVHYSNYENSEEDYNQDEENYDAADISNMSCSEILETVVDNGDLLSELTSSEMDSEALDYIALYEYENMYFVIVEFTSSNQQYVYCDIAYNAWNNFIDNAGDSYGSSFNEYLTHSNCNCD